MTKGNDRFKIYNYCVSWLDLLGHKSRYQNKGLLPPFASATEEQEFHESVKQSVGVIDDLQSDTDALLKPMLRGYFFRKKKLPPRLRPLHYIYEEMRKSRIVKQQFADTILCYSAIDAPAVRNPMMDVYFIMAQAGLLCFLGLVKACPVRGAIDVAWGTELHARELNGPAFVNAYSLENQAALWPRIVVGEGLVSFLNAWAQSQDTDIRSRHQKYWAVKCKAFISIDTDRLPFVDYLSDAFTELIPSEAIEILYTKAVNFIRNQMDEHRKSGNLKLLGRYGQLLTYYKHRSQLMKHAAVAV